MVPLQSICTTSSVSWISFASSEVASVVFGTIWLFAHDALSNILFFCFLFREFAACCFVCLGPIPWLIVAELFPQNVRALAAGVAGVVNWLCNYVIGQFFRVMLVSVTEILSEVKAKFVYGSLNPACRVLLNAPLTGILYQVLWRLPANIHLLRLFCVKVWLCWRISQKHTCSVSCA